MGALVTFFRYFALVASGYFGGIIEGWISNLIPGIKSKDGSISWWGVLLISAVVALVIGAIVYVVAMVVPHKKRRR